MQVNTSGLSCNELGQSRDADAHRSRQLDEAGVEVFARQRLQMPVYDLAPLKVSVEEMAGYTGY